MEVFGLDLEVECIVMMEIPLTTLKEVLLRSDEDSDEPLLSIFESDTT
jgi:hypothetical protein